MQSSTQSRIPTTQIKEAISLCQKISECLKSDKVPEVIELINKNKATVFNYQNLVPNHNLCFHVNEIAVELSRKGAKEEAAFLFKLAMQTAESKREEHQMRSVQIFTNNMRMLVDTNIDSAKAFFKEYSPVLMNFKKLKPNHSTCAKLSSAGVELQKKGAREEASFFYKLAMQAAESKTEEHQRLFVIAFTNNMKMLVVNNIDSAKAFFKEHSPVLMNIENLVPNYQVCVNLSIISNILYRKGAKEEAAFLCKLAMQTAESKTEKHQMHSVKIFTNNMRMLVDTNIDSAKAFFKEYSPVLMNFKKLKPNHSTCAHLNSAGVELQKKGVSEEASFFYKLAMQTAESKTEEHQRLFVAVFTNNMNMLVDSNIDSAKAFFKEHSPVLMNVENLLPNYQACVNLNIMTNRLYRKGAKEEAAVFCQLAIRTAEDKTPEHWLIQILINSKFIAIYLDLPLKELTKDLLKQSALKILELLKKVETHKTNEDTAEALLLAAIALEKRKFPELALSLLENILLLPRSIFKFEDQFKKLLLEGAWEAAAHLLTMFIRNNKKLPFDLNSIVIGEKPYIIFLAQSGQEELLTLSRQLGANLAVFTAADAKEEPGCSSLYYAGIYGHARVFSLLVKEKIPFYFDVQSLKAKPFIHKLVMEAQKNRTRFEDYCSILRETIEYCPSERERQMATEFVKKNYPNLQDALQNKLERQIRRFILTNKTLNDILLGNAYLSGTFSEETADDEPEPIQDIVGYLSERILTLETLIKPELNPGVVSQEFYEELIRWKMNWQTEARLSARPTSTESKEQKSMGLDSDTDSIMAPVPSRFPVQDTDIAVKQINDACEFIAYVYHTSKMDKTKIDKKCVVVYHPKLEDQSEETITQLSATPLTSAHPSTFYGAGSSSSSRKRHERPTTELEAAQPGCKRARIVNEKQRSKSIS